MTTFQIAGYLTEFAGGRAEIKLEGEPHNVGEALNQLWDEHAGLRDRVLTEQGQVRPHVNVFVNSQVVQRDQVLQVPISGDTEICIMPAVSGGDHNGWEMELVCFVCSLLAGGMLLALFLLFCDLTAGDPIQRTYAGPFGFILNGILFLPLIGIERPTESMVGMTLVFDLLWLTLGIYFLTGMWRYVEKRRHDPITGTAR